MKATSGRISPFSRRNVEDNITEMAEELRDERQRGMDTAANGKPCDEHQSTAFQQGHEYQLIVIEHQNRNRSSEQETQ